jgi:hypothetical protein
MWKCDKCGQEMEDQFDKCWSCSTDDPAMEDKEATPAKKAKGTVVKVLSFVIILFGMGLFWNTLFMAISGVVAVGSRYLGAGEVLSTGFVMLLGLGFVFVGKLIYDNLPLFVGITSVLYTGLLFINRSVFRQSGEEGRIPQRLAEALVDTSLPMAVVILVAGIGLIVYSRRKKASA